MRVFQINAVPYGSTGSIMFRLADAVRQQGHQVLCTTGFTWKKCSRSDHFITSNIIEKSLHIHLARITGRLGCFSRAATRRMLRQMDEFAPDVIHLHNLHGWFVNLPMLFGYIREKKIPVIWTLHDCWAFTGHCAHYDGIGCEKWKTGCYSCPLYCRYPRTYFDYSKTMYRLKKEWFSGVEDLTIVTPSQWLADQVRQSFLAPYPVRVIHNGIDLQVFSPDCGGNRVCDSLSGKHIVLGVAYAWDDKKGLDVLIELDKRLPENYKIVIVGTDEHVERLLPENIVSIRRTRNREELAQLYAAADVFVNPTREDNFPTVNMEALACGTPVVTFNTGGSPEIPDESCGIVVPKNDIGAMEQQILRICESQPYSKEACTARAAAFPQERAVDQYLCLYRSKV